MKMEQTACFEASAYTIQTPGNYPEESIKHSEQGEILKSRTDLINWHWCIASSVIMACATAYVVECEKLGTLLGLNLCREYKNHWRFGGLTASFFRILSWQGATDSDFAANIFCSPNFGINWKFVWTKQPTGQKKVQGRNTINALTKDFLPS